MDLGLPMCYTGQGILFSQVTTSDTVKVGYDVYLYENGVDKYVVGKNG